MIVLIESHRQERAPRLRGLVVPEAGARWGKAAEFGFDLGAEEEDGAGVNEVERSSNPTRIQLWNLSPVWRAFDVVKVPSSEDPSQTIEATVTRAMLFPVETSTQKYVGGGVGYVEDPGHYGYQLRTIHTFVLLSVPSPVPDAEVVSGGQEGEWPEYPEEMFQPGRFFAHRTAPRTLDAMRWADLARLYTPVAATPLQRTRPGLPPPIPVSGGRWGRPSSFSWSSEGAKESEPEQSVVDRTPSGNPVEYMRIINAQLLVASEKVRVHSETDPSVWVDIDRLSRMVFQYTDYPPKSRPSGMTPTQTTYFDLAFDLHPSPSEEA